MTNRKPQFDTPTILRRFLRALGDCKYVFGVSSTTGVQRKTLSMEYMENDGKIIGWWRSANAAGSNIYVAPAPSNTADADAEKYYAAIILVDDLTQDAVTAMYRSGYDPAAVVETSPNNFQAWVHISSKNFAAAAIMKVARFLAKEFDGDMNAALPGQFGRLPGFTNRKDKYARMNTYGNIQFPFCRLRSAKDSPPLWCRRHSELLEMLEEVSVAPTRRRQQVKDLSEIKIPARQTNADLVAQVENDKMNRRLKADYGAKFDASRADWMVIISLIKQGVPYISIAKALIFSAETALSKRKKDIPYYLLRTFKKAHCAVYGTMEVVFPEDFLYLMENLEDFCE